MQEKSDTCRVNSDNQHWDEIVKHELAENDLVMMFLGSGQTNGAVTHTRA